MMKMKGKIVEVMRRERDRQRELTLALDRQRQGGAMRTENFEKCCITIFFFFWDKNCITILKP